MGNWSPPIGKQSCTAKAKTDADWLHKSKISKPDFNRVITLFLGRLLAELTK
jgi:hypothetical protein